MWHWSLITGTVVKWTVVLGVLALLFLFADTGKRWWTRWVPGAVVGGVGFALLAKFIVEDVWKPFPDKIELHTCGLIALLTAAVVLAVGKIMRRRWYFKVLAVLAVVLVIPFVGIQVNRIYGWYPSMSGLFGHLPVEKVDLADYPKNVQTVAPAEGQSLMDAWQPPKDLPRHGVLAAMDPPATVSGFRARGGWIYLPPAYQVVPRPVLPVLVVVSGQPGSPRDWIDSAQIVEMMDEYAAQHEGLAPVVVMPDQLGGLWNNTMCVDSKLGNSFTYLAVDVPAFIDKNLTVAEGPESWAIGGLSQGGTCSLQMAVNAPNVYGRFVDLSGEKEPSLGTHAETLNEGFGGDEEAFKKVNPLDVMAGNRFPNTAGRFTVGEKDKMGGDLKVVYEAAAASGMDVEFTTVPGAHDMNAWRDGMRSSLPWLGDHLGITAPRS